MTVEPHIRTDRLRWLACPRGVVGRREPRASRLTTERQIVRQALKGIAIYDLLLDLIRVCMYVMQRQEPPPCNTPNSQQYKPD